MSYTIIDRRTNPRGKNLPNRQRFLRRNARAIRQYLGKKLQGGITDSQEQEVKIDTDDIAEHNFVYDSDFGNWNRVLPGNRNFRVNDRIPRPSSGSGTGGSQAGTGDSEDEFVFHLSREEYLDMVFDGLELHNLERRNTTDTELFTRSRAGFSHQGPSNNLDLVKTLKNSIGRRRALAGPLDREIAELENQLEQVQDAGQKAEILEKLLDLRSRRATVCYIDPVDLRYRRFQQTPSPQSRAVMFCILDVSASMTERKKEIAKRFYLLLYLFLTKNYKKVDLIFIRHTDSAEEVTEQEFFYGTHSGGTTVSSGIQLMSEIIADRYNPSDWNIYAAQATDGDNYPNDNEKVQELLRKVLPVTQFYIYNEISDRSEVLDEYYESSATVLYRVLSRLQSEYPHLEINILDSTDVVVKKFRKIFTARPKS